MSFGKSGGRALLTCVAGLVEDEGLDGDLLGAFSVGFLLAGALLLEGREVALTSPSITVLCMLPNKLKEVGVGFFVGGVLVGLELDPAMVSV
jgi:hypothetical protein